MNYIIGETIDKYLGYHYYINSVMLKSQHKNPYVAIEDNNDIRVAMIYIRTKEIDFYSSTPDAVKRDIKIFETWIGKNYKKCVKVWNRLNPKYPI
jgi:hypothetical protein